MMHNFVKDYDVFSTISTRMMAFFVSMITILKISTKYMCVMNFFLCRRLRYYFIRSFFSLHLIMNKMCAAGRFAFGPIADGILY